MITVNTIREPIRHIVNEERESELGVEIIIAADDFGINPNPISATPRFTAREGKIIRRIQRESNAIDARIWAAGTYGGHGVGSMGGDDAVVSGPWKTNDQEIYVRRFYDQGAILLRPALFMKEPGRV